jgi:hypothetical protein
MISVLAVLLLLSRLAAAQTCPCPQADTFAALEPDTHDAPGALFRGILPDTAGAQCAVDTSITNLLATIPQPGAVFETVEAPAFGGLLFAIKLKSEFATLTGALDDGNPPAACFKLDVQGLVHVPSPITITNGCGSQMMAIGQPKYACVLGPPIGKTLVCFAAKVVGVKEPLPPGFDRLEDVCTVVDVL